MNNVREILEDNKEKIIFLLNEFKKNYVLYNMNPTISEYETNYTNIKVKIQELMNKVNTIIEKNDDYINKLNEKIESLNKNKVKSIPFIRNNAKKIMLLDTNNEYNQHLINNADMIISIIILIIIFYKGSK
uniref:Uncharacterized protein n=1 Tax=viral metagenome TaxID=1070528 RepID=A0A6C0H5K5_9ZZZZ